MFNNANKSIFIKNLHRLNHINGLRQSVEMRKMPQIPDFKVLACGVQGDQNKLLKIVAYISYLVIKMELVNVYIFDLSS